jgi:hypothetical protein
MTLGLAMIIGVLMLVLHRGDGAEVDVAVAHITSLRAPAGPLRGLAPTSGCIVGLADGKFVGVLETCGEVRRRLEEAGH